MQNDYIDFKFGDHWASEFNLLAVSSSDRYTPPVYGNVNPNIATIMGKKGVYKWKTQINEKIFNINIAFDSVTIAQLNQIKQWLQPNKIQKLIFSEEPYKYYWAALNAEIDFSHLPFVEGEKQVGERTIIEGVYKGEMVISFVCIDNDGYSTEGTFEGLETENPSNTIKGNDFVLTDADNDYIENLKIEGKSKQETKYNNTLSDTDFADVNSRSVEKAWKTNNLAQIQAENGEVTISAPYQYSGIAQEQREALIDHKYFASAEINTDSLDTALEIAGKNITNSIEGKDINITDGLVGPVDDLIVSGDASQDKLYNNEINSSFLEDLDNWDNQNNGKATISKQKATVTANEKYDGISQYTEENNVGDKYYVRAKVQSNNTETALEVETEKGSAEGSSITINDASDNKLENIRIEGKHSQEHYDQKDLGEGEIISYNNTDNYQRYTKVSISGNSAQEVVEEVPGTEVEGESITAQDITLPKGRIGVYGNSKQETREGYSIWDYLSVARSSADGLTIEKDFEEGYITVNGTPNSNYVNLCTQENITDMLEDGQTYTLWQEKYADSNTKGIYLQVTERTSNGKKIYFSRDNAVNFTVNKQNTTYRIGLQTGKIEDTGALINYKNRYMIYKGTDTKTYELPGATPSIKYPSEVKCLGSNKQLFDKDNANKINATPSGSSIIASSSGKSFYLEVNPNTNYSVSRKVIGQRFVACTTSQIPTAGVSLTQNITNNTGEEINIKTGANDKYLLVYYLYNNSENEEEILSNIKIEEGTEATSYSPFGQGSTEIVKFNKNYIKTENSNGTKSGINYNIQNGVVQINGTNSLTTNNNIKFNQYQNYDCKEFPYGQDITFSCEGISDLEGKGDVAIGEFDETGKWIRNLCILSQDISKTFNISKLNNKAKYVRASAAIYANQTVNCTLKPMLELGNVKTDFASRQENNYILPIQQEMLKGDYFIKEADDWKEVHGWNKIILTGKENWIYEQSNDQFGVYDLTFPAANTSITQYCNYYSKYDRYVQTGNSFGTTGQYVRISNKDTNWKLEEFKNFLQTQHNTNTPAYIWYKLESPTQLLCTKEQSAVLEELSNMDLFEGVNNIITTEDIALLKLKYNYVLPSPSPEAPSEIQNIRDSIKIKLSNKNLFNKNSIFTSSNHQFSSENGEIIEAGGGEWKALETYIEVKENCNYVLSGKIMKRSWRITIWFYDKDKKGISKFSMNNVDFYNFTTPEGTKYIRFLANTSVLDASTIQLEEGEEKTNYIEHQEKNINFPLSEGQKLMKGDYLARDGIHHVRKQKTLPNATNLIETNVFGTDCKLAYYPLEGSEATGRNYDFKSNKIAPANEVWGQYKGYKNGTNINVLTTLDDTLENFNSKISGSIVEYELAEEEIEEYTETQKEIYNNLTHLIMYNGQNTLSSSNELKPQLKWEIPESPSPDYPIEIKTVNNDLIVTSTNGENEKQNIDIDVQKDLLEGDYLDLNDNVESHSWNYKELNGTENWQENMNYTTSTLLVVQLEIENINLLVQDGLCTHFKYNNDNTTPNTFKVIENNLLIVKLNKSEFATLEKFKGWLVQQKEKSSVKIYWKTNIIQNLSLTSNQKTELQKIKSYREITKISSNNALQPNIKVEYIKKPLHTTKLTGNTEQLLSLIYQTNINKTKILLNNISNNNNTFTFTHPILINLTKQFGSGKEPTKEWLDTNIDFWSVAEGGAPSVETSSRVRTVGGNINLFDPDNHIELDGQYRHYSEGKIVNSANFFGIKVPVLGNTVYSVNSNLSRGGYSNLCYYNKDSVFMWGEPFTEGQTFRTPFNCRYITLALNKNYDWFTLTYGEIPIQKVDYNLANIDMQISGYDNQFKSFPLAKGQELLQLPNGTQDTLEADGIHKRVEKIIINGTENWLKQNGVNHEKTWRFIFSRTNGSLSSAKNNCYCDKFINYSADDLWNEDIEGIAVSKSQVIIRINSEKAESVVELKQLLQDNNLVLYLPKVSEEIIPYSNAQKAWYDEFEIYRKNTQITTIAETKPWYSFTYDINDTYSVNSTKVNEYEKLGLIFNNLEDRPRFIVNRTAEGSGMIKMRKPLVVDLTNVFGAEKEPDLAWCLENITFDNSCEYGTPSPNVPSELVSVGSNPIKIENKSRNLIKEQNLLNWTKEYCTAKRLTEKYDNRNIYRISFENHKKGTISTRIQQKKGNMVLSIYARIIQADDPTVNRLTVAKVTSDSSASTVVSHKSLENLIGEWQKIYIPITAESISDAAELVLEVQHNADTDDSTIIDLCMPQLEEGFTPHDYIPYAPEKVNNLTFTTPLRQLKNGVRDEFSKDGIIRRIGEHTIKSTDTVHWIVFNQDKDYVTICGQLGIYVRGDSSWNAPSFYCNRIEDCTSLYGIAQAKNPAPSRTKEGIGIIDSEYRMCLRADLMGIVETDTEEDMIRKYKVLLDEKPFTIYYEKEVADIEPLTELQKNTLANLVTRKQYDHWLISGDLNPEVELSYKLTSSINDIHPWVTGSNLLDKTWFYNDNNIHTKPYVEVDTGDADKSGISATRPIYLLNSGTETANLSLTFDYINIETPLTIQTYSGKFTDDGFVEEAKVSEITIEPFTNYQPFKDIYDNNPANWKIEIDSTLGEVYLRHNTDETKVLNLNRFNKDHTFLSLADCNFVDYDKVFPTIISEIEGTAIENTIFNKVIIANTADNYRLKNVNVEWKHTYL